MDEILLSTIMTIILFSSCNENCNVQATPTVFLINEEGIITWKSLGYVNNVNEAAKKLFNE